MNVYYKFCNKIGMLIIYVVYKYENIKLYGVYNVRIYWRDVFEFLYEDNFKVNFYIILLYGNKRINDVKLEIK